VGTTESTTSSTDDNCHDAGCKNAFNGLGMCVETSRADWVNISRIIDLSAGIMEGKCSQGCGCNCFKHVGCFNSECDAQNGICLIPELEDEENRGFFIPSGYEKAFPCNADLDCFCYIRNSISTISIPETTSESETDSVCNHNRRCARRGGQCYGRGETIPHNAIRRGWCNRRRGCKCYVIET